MVGRRSVDTDVDENGQPIKANEPKVSRKTGKRRVGKPRAITKAKIERICNTIRAGNYVKTSVIANGVNYNTFMDYMRQGKNGIRPYDEYYQMVEMAKAGFETDAVSTISDSGKDGNVGAYMWMLPRMFPQRWGTVQRQEVKVDNTQEIKIVRFSDKNKEE